MINREAQSLCSGKLSLLSQFQHLLVFCLLGWLFKSGNPSAISLLRHYRVLATDYFKRYLV